MQSPVRVGILGLTHDHIWGEAPHLAARSDAVIVAAADPHRELAGKFAAQFKCKSYIDPAAMIRSEKLDAVCIFTENALHAEYVELAAAAGLHAMVEKPMAADLAGADRMLAAVARSKTRLMINWPFAWWPQMQHALAMIQSGAIGRVWEVKYRAAHHGPRELGCSSYFCDWLYDEKRNGGGAFADYTCYGALIARHLLGMPRSVTGWSARLVKTDIPVDDNALILMHYDNALALAEGSWTQLDDMTNYRPHFYGAAGTLLLEPKAAGKLHLATAADLAGHAVDIPAPAAHLRNSAAHFLHLIADPAADCFPLVDPKLARDAQAIMQAARESNRSGQRVAITS